MDVSLHGKIVVVTGATQGVGEAIARLAARSNVGGIAICGRNRQRGADVAAALHSTRAPAIFIEADMMAPEAPATIMNEAITAFGRVDALVNSAGITDRASFTNATPADWEKLFAINARAPFFMMQALICHLLERGAPGSIVNIQSMNAHCGIPELAVYSATKGALATLTKNAANAHLGDRIRVNGINMGWAATPAERAMQAETLGQGADWETNAAIGLPLGRLLSSEEVAQLAVFLLSDASGLMTGTSIDLEQKVVGALA
jgi:NAD(P)-dependent dehydrogenase (short-subunit alcohol dehydrogenase family)